MARHQATVFFQPPVTADKLAAFEHVDLAISITYSAWASLLNSTAASVACGTPEPFQNALQKALEPHGGLKVLKGTNQDITSFFGYFDPPQTTFQALTLR